MPDDVTYDDILADMVDSLIEPEPAWIDGWLSIRAIAEGRGITVGEAYRIMERAVEGGTHEKRLWKKWNYYRLKPRLP